MRMERQKMVLSTIGRWRQKNPVKARHMRQRTGHRKGTTGDGGRGGGSRPPDTFRIATCTCRNVSTTIQDPLASSTSSPASLPLSDTSKLISPKLISVPSSLPSPGESLPFLILQQTVSSSFLLLTFSRFLYIALHFIEFMHEDSSGSSFVILQY